MAELLEPVLNPVLQAQASEQLNAEHYERSEDRTLSELAEPFDVHQNQIQDWRKRLLENADSVFCQGQQQQQEAASQVKALHAKISPLTMERDFLEEGLERIHGPIGKK